VYLLIDPRTRRAAVAAAGHLPLVLVRAGQDPELVDAGSGSTPLGWPEVRHQRTLELGPGDLLLGVTDGVVERRGYDLDDGLAQLVDVVGSTQAGLTQLVERVAATMLEYTQGRDDATLLAVRFTA
jgi:serine phosphatase RsbU (regulator of sigma subunit)